MLYLQSKELAMDYTEAELEARIFPSVDLDPRDWEEDCEEQEIDEVYDDIEDAPVERLGIEAYAHWNEDARMMWWLEEGRW